MKYKIVVEKSSCGVYTAYSPVAANIKASGETITEVMKNLQSRILCYLHDPQIELDIIIEYTSPEAQVFQGIPLRQMK